MEDQPIKPILKTAGGVSNKGHGQQRRYRGKWGKFRKKYLEGKANWEGYYTCNSCKRNFKEIDLDHIVKRSVRPDLIFVEENIQMLCRSCHIAKDGGFRVK